jgi:hypothetical protein
MTIRGGFVHEAACARSRAGQIPHDGDVAMQDLTPGLLSKSHFPSLESASASRDGQSARFRDASRRPVRTSVRNLAGLTLRPLPPRPRQVQPPGRPLSRCRAAGLAHDVGRQERAARSRLRERASTTQARLVGVLRRFREVILGALGPLAPRGPRRARPTASRPRARHEPPPSKIAEPPQPVAPGANAARSLPKRAWEPIELRAHESQNRNVAHASLSAAPSTSPAHQTCSPGGPHAPICEFVPLSEAWWIALARRLRTRSRP